MDKPYKLLIIDDNEKILDLLESFFRLKNYSVETASCGLEGLKLLGKGSFDLVITDIVLPNISGVGIISIIKKKYPDIPVIAITGWGKHLKELAIEAKVDMIVGKPVKPSELEKFIVDLLSNMKTESIKKSA